MIELESGAQCLWQWNTMQRIVTDYPPGTVMDFTQSNTDALERTTYEVGSRTMVDIPNAILQLAGTLYIYVHHTEGGQLTTVLEASYPVRAQPRPRNYVNDEAEIQIWHQLESRLDKLEKDGTGGGPADAVRYDHPQELTEEQQELARRNIGAASDQEDQLVLIEEFQIVLIAQKLVEKKAEPDGTAYSFRAVSVSVSIPASEDPAKDLQITLGWANGDQDVFRFGPVAGQTCSVYLERRDGVKRGTFSVHKNGVKQSRSIETMPAAAALSSVRIEAGGLGLESGTFVEIQAVREKNMKN